MESRSSFEGTLIAMFIGSVAIVSAVLLAAGFLTPLAGVLGGLSAFLTNGLTGACVAVVAAAIVLLGPGAYSVVARLLGRREIVIARQK